MEKVKIKNVNTGAIKEVAKVLATDYIGTKEFVLVNETENKPKYEKFEDKEEFYISPKHKNRK